MGDDVYRYGNTCSFCQLLHLEGGIMAEKKTVTSTLRDMDLYEKVSFPLAQRTYVFNTICGRMDKERREGMKWSVETRRDDNIVVVTRTA